MAHPWTDSGKWARMPWTGDTGVSAGEWWDAFNLLLVLAAHFRLAGIQIAGPSNTATPTHTYASWDTYLTAAVQGASIVGSLDGRVLYGTDPADATVGAHMTALRATVAAGATLEAELKGLLWAFAAPTFKRAAVSYFEQDTAFLLAMMLVPIR